MAPKAPKAEAKVKFLDRHNPKNLNVAEANAIDEILSKDPNGLSAGEKAHLQARAIYLTADEKESHLG